MNRQEQDIKLNLKSIKSLIDSKYKFFIPSYQRGYRWSKEQITELLDDILEFQKNAKNGEFYCLQPIVIKKIKDTEYWEVIDGQQRLTTIYIILMVFYNRWAEDEDVESELYTLTYDTRKDSGSFLKNIRNTKAPDKTNIDYYHMSSAYITVKNWVKEKKEKKKIDQGKFIDTLTVEVLDDNNNDIKENIRVIWYEIDEKNNNEIDVFTRINMGKIELTNAELIKASLLKVSNQTDEMKRKIQFERASQWDNIEFSLRDEEFWYFITGKKDNRVNRIEFIFDLIAKKYMEDFTEEDKVFYTSIERYRLFHIFNKVLDDNENIDSIWKDIKDYHARLKEWYEYTDKKMNYEYYHLIGFLTSCNISIYKIMNDTNKKDKTFLLNYLKREIKIKISGIGLEELDYNEGQKHKDTIKNVLLLFNIISTIKSYSNTKFQFSKYIDEVWSLEHIHAQNSASFTDDNQRKEWLKTHMKFFNGKNQNEIINKIKLLLKTKTNIEDAFEKIQNEIFLKYSDEISIKMHGLSNMALLSKDNNSKLNNSIFPIKREKIMELDENGAFIPICTKNVFLKYYSKDASNLSHWSKENDADAYFKTLENTITKYLTQREVTHD